MPKPHERERRQTRAAAVAPAVPRAQPGPGRPGEAPQPVPGAVGWPWGPPACRALSCPSPKALRGRWDAESRWIWGHPALQPPFEVLSAIQPPPRQPSQPPAKLPRGNNPARSVWANRAGRRGHGARRASRVPASPAQRPGGRARASDRGDAAGEPGPAAESPRRPRAGSGCQPSLGHRLVHPAPVPGTRPRGPLGTPLQQDGLFLQPPPRAAWESRQGHPLGQGLGRCRSPVREHRCLPGRGRSVPGAMGSQGLPAPAGGSRQQNNPPCSPLSPFNRDRGQGGKIHPHIPAEQPK